VGAEEEKQMTQHKHSPLPWKYTVEDDAGKIIIRKESGFKTICGEEIGQFSSRDDADLCLRACNVHYSLIDAFKWVLDEVIVPEPNCRCHISPPCNDCVNHASIREAIEYSRKIIKQAEAA
jgi:hypothetical protein